MGKFSDRCFLGVFSRLLRSAGMTPESDPEFAILAQQIASASYPKAKYADLALSPLISAGRSRRATEAYLVGDLRTFGELVHTIWGLTTQELGAVRVGNGGLPSN